MEAIKFSELPSGDKQDLDDSDGLPIIANKENRLLSWGQLKRQIAKQTHTTTVLTDSENVDKVPTNGAIEARISGLADELDERIGVVENTASTAQITATEAKTIAESAEASATNASSAANAASVLAGEAKSTADSASSTANLAGATATTAKTTADSALAMAETAQTSATSATELATTAKTTADGAKADATRYYGELNGKTEALMTAQQTLRTDLETETGARETAVSGVRTDLTSLSIRVGDIETQIANGELGGGSDSEAETIDLTPITNRLTALESADTDHETRLDTLETAKTAQAGRIAALETTITSQATSISEADGRISALEQSTNVLNSDNESISVATAIAEVRTAAANAQTSANSARSIADSATTTAESATTLANTANATASAAQTAAGAAQATAEAAQTAATTAQTSANTAQTTAEATSAALETAINPSVLIKNYSFMIDESTGEIVGWSESSSGDSATATNLLTVLQRILENQEQFYKAINSLRQTARTYDQDIDAILTNITNTLNAVTA